jgi:hypothetical protein
MSVSNFFFNVPEDYINLLKRTARITFSIKNNNIHFNISSSSDYYILKYLLKSARVNIIIILNINDLKVNIKLYNHIIKNSYCHTSLKSFNIADFYKYIKFKYINNLEILNTLYFNKIDLLCNSLYNKDKRVFKYLCDKYIPILIEKNILYKQIKNYVFNSQSIKLIVKLINMNYITLNDDIYLYLIENFIYYIINLSKMSQKRITKIFNIMNTIELINCINNYFIIYCNKISLLRQYALTYFNEDTRIVLYDYIDTFNEIVDYKNNPDKYIRFTFIKVIYNIVRGVI